MAAKLSALLLVALQIPSLLGATFTVINTDATGPGSFEQAILDANLADGLDEIAFEIPGDDPHIITIREIPNITSPVTIDGFTQPGARPNALLTANDAVLKIQLDGAGTFNAGLRLSTSGNTIRGLSITRYMGDGIRINAAANGNTIAGNFIGVNSDPASFVDGGNRVGVSVSSANNMIGGTSPADANIISDNAQYGVSIQTAGGNENFVMGNLIGLAANGARKANSSNGAQIDSGTGNRVEHNIISGNFGAGVVVSAANETIIQDNAIGSDLAGEAARANSGDGIHLLDSHRCVVRRNLVSGNSLRGIVLSSGSSDNSILGNLIGVSGSQGALRNNSHGIYVSEGAARNRIGDASAEGRNIIAYNNGAGAYLFQAGEGNSIRGNSIHDQVGLGIDLDAPGITPNDDFDADEGSNGAQNFPNITGAVITRESTTVSGTLHSNPSTAYTIDLYVSPTLDPSGNGEGRTWLATLAVTTDALGNAPFEHQVLPPHHLNVISATATAPGGNTSEFGGSFNARAAVPERTFSVTTTADSGPGSLRQAILDSNADFGFDTINFAIAGEGDKIVHFLTPLPSPLNSVTIDGNSQGAAAPAATAPRYINLVGSALPAGSSGLTLTAPSNTIRGLSFSGFPAFAIDLRGEGNTITANWIGVNALGEAAGNGAGGIRISGNGNRVVNGGPPGNLISGNNGPGILITSGARENLIQRNAIGLNPALTAAMPNTGSGIRVENSPGNIIGGINVPNVICANTGYGIELIGAATTQTTIQNNFIGTDSTSRRLGNQLGGIRIAEGANGTAIGAQAANSRNTIAFNGGHGVWVESGNRNSIVGNLITRNTGRPILISPGANVGYGPAVLRGARPGSVIYECEYASPSNEPVECEYYMQFPDPTDTRTVAENCKEGSATLPTPAIPLTAGTHQWIVSCPDAAVDGMTAYFTVTQGGNTHCSEVLPVVAEPQGPILVLTKSAQPQAEIGERVRYTITVRNIGTEVAPDVAITDHFNDLIPVPLGGPFQKVATSKLVNWHVGDIVPGGSATVEVDAYSETEASYLNEAAAFTSFEGELLESNVDRVRVAFVVPTVARPPFRIDSKTAVNGVATYPVPGTGPIQVINGVAGVTAILDEPRRLVTVTAAADEPKTFSTRIVISSPEGDQEHTAFTLIPPVPVIAMEATRQGASIVLRLTGLPTEPVTINAAATLAGPWIPVSTIASSTTEGAAIIPIAPGAASQFLMARVGPPDVLYAGNQAVVKIIVPPDLETDATYAFRADAAAVGPGRDGILEWTEDTEIAPEITERQFYVGAPARAGNTRRMKLHRVADPNNPPIVDFIPNQNVSIGSAFLNIPSIQIADIETPSDQLQVSIVSSNPAFCPASNVSLAGTGPARTLMIAPTPAVEGTCDVTISVSDGVLTSISTFQVTVSPAPDLDLFPGRAAEILVANAENEFALATIEGQDIVVRTPLVALLPWTDSLEFAAAFDANADGECDFIFHNNRGSFLVCQSDPALEFRHCELADLAPEIAAGWEPRCSGDFDGNGVEEIVFQQAAPGTAIALGTLDLYRSRVSTVMANTTAPLPAGALIVGAADMNGDGKDDLLHKGATGVVSVMLMDGATQTGGGTINPAPNPEEAFEVLLIRNFDGDNAADLFVTYPATGRLAIRMLNADWTLREEITLTGPPNGPWRYPGR